MTKVGMDVVPKFQVLNCHFLSWTQNFLDQEFFSDMKSCLELSKNSSFSIPEGKDPESEDPTFQVTCY